MPRAIRIAIVAATAPLALIAWASVVFAMDRASNGGEVLGGVSVGGVELSGLSEAQARRAVLRLEELMARTPMVFEVEGTRFEVLPEQIGFGLDEDFIVAAALRNGRDGGLGRQFRWWLGHLGNRGNTSVEVAGTFDPAALEPFLAGWEQTAIDAPPFEGGVAVQSGTVVAMYPRPGTGIDRAATVDLVEEVIFNLERPPIQVPTALRTPTLTEADVDAALAEAEALINGPVILSRLNPEVQVRFDRQLLGAALRSRVTGSPEAPFIELYFDRRDLMAYLEPRRASIEFPPVDAQVVIRPDDIPTIIPGRSELLVDERKLPEAVLEAATSVTRAGAFPYLEGEQPEFSTEDAEGLGIKELLYTATTYYTPNGDQNNLNRIHNIHLMADMVNGAIVMPGEVFSLNGHVGQRTEAKGFKLAGAIIGDIVDCCDHPANWGGGVSQFTTTMYNAVFFSGLEDVEHTPHTLYISRYPEGREATLGWPEPDLKFRNNTAAAVYIKTEHTDDSITVKFFGDNGGIEVEAQLSERRDFTSPNDHYDAEDEITPGEQEITDDGSPGWTVTVYRIIRYPDGSETTESWIWRYHPWPKRISVHPCDLPEDHEDYLPDVVCPSVVPDLIGRNLDYAWATLGNRGLTLVQGEPYPVNTPEEAGRVWSQDPPSGSLLEAGGVVTVRVGVLAGGG